MGLTGYYKKFVQNYGRIAAPLTDLLKKDAFKWGEKEQQAFEALKESMITVTVLAMPDFSKPFEIEADASNTGVGAVLMQNKRPIAYFSQVLSQKARLSSVYEKELAALIFAIKKWHHYLRGHPFIIRTDQKALKHLLEQKEMDCDQQKWVSKLMSLKFEIHYKPGSENRAVDALSRRGETVELKAYSLWQYPDVEEWNKEVQNDERLYVVIRQLLVGQPTVGPYTMKRGCLLYKERMALPRKSTRIPKLLEEFHSSLLGGHSRYLRTYKRLAEHVH